MTTRVELGARLNKQMDGLNDRIFTAHAQVAGCTYIGEFRMRSTEELCADFRKELAGIQSSKETEEFLGLAPDMREQFDANVRLVIEAINEYELAVRSVYRAGMVPDASPYEHSARPRSTNFCVYKYWESTTHKSGWGTLTYRGGKPITFAPGYQGPHSRSWYE